MNAFEKQIAETFESYKTEGIAVLYFLYPPMRPAGRLGPMPCYIPTKNGKAPYDVTGYFMGYPAIAIGAELKETKSHDNRLTIVLPGKPGSGLQYHQLTGLVDLHKSGGYAMLLWNNGGQIGRIDGDQLAAILLDYDSSLRAEEARKEIAKGSRSIAWERFKPIVDEQYWLPKQSLPRSQRRAV